MATNVSTLLSNFALDVRQAMRGLGRRPGFAAVAVFTLALAIGANTAIFSLVHAVLLQPLPFTESENLVQVWEAQKERGQLRNVVNPGNFLRWKERATSFERLSGYTSWPLNMAGDVAPERLQAGLVDGEFFATLGARAVRGRLIEPTDAAVDAPDVVVLSEGLWRRRFGARDVIGSEVRLDGTIATIVGVAEPSLALPADAELWTALQLGPTARDARGRWMSVVGRLKPGVSQEAAHQEMAALGQALSAERPEMNAGWGVNAVPLREEMVGRLRPALLLLFGAVGLVLMIACANVAGLLLARAAERQREIAVRQALGAGRGRLASLALAESLPLALAGGALGLAFSALFLRALLAFTPIDLPRYAMVRLDPMVLGFTALAAVFCALASGLLPALARRRQDMTLLRTSGLGVQRLRGRMALVTSEIALSVVLIAGAGLLIQSLNRLAQVDLGFPADQLATFQLSLPAGAAESAYRDPANVRRTFAEVETRLAALPGVRAVGGISWLPLTGRGAATSLRALDQPEPAPGQSPSATIRIVTPSLVETLGIPLLSGRGFDGSDTAEGPVRALLSASMAKELWPDADPLGRTVRVHWGRSNEPIIDAEIVGVVADARLEELGSAPRGTLYFAQQQVPSSFLSFVLRTDLPASALAEPVRAIVAQLDPDLPVAALQPLDAVIDKGLRASRFSASLLGALALLALVLAAVGLYGLMAHAVAQRGREFGLRLALGATPGRLFTGVLRDAARPVALGLAIGVVGAIGASRLLSSLLFETATTDPGAFALTLVVLVAAAFVACALPAWRATRVAPIEALRAE
jgi:putative ABC transport system permease protein